MGHCPHTLIYKWPIYTTWPIYIVQSFFLEIVLVWDTALTLTQPPYPPFLPANNRYNCPIISFLFILIENICLIYNEIFFHWKYVYFIFTIHNISNIQHPVEWSPLSLSATNWFFYLILRHPFEVIYHGTVQRNKQNIAKMQKNKWLTLDWPIQPILPVQTIDTNVW